MWLCFRRCFSGVPESKLPRLIFADPLTRSSLTLALAFLMTSEFRVFLITSEPRLEYETKPFLEDRLADSVGGSPIPCKPKQHRNKMMVITKKQAKESNYLMNCNLNFKAKMVFIKNKLHFIFNCFEEFFRLRVI